ncbi:Chondroitin proteoglycan 4 [Caenorhabditis elegans]|uniref:Chondroitin proteoglycan 4 n=1 Tax=Caenorhabditis elegans TaxID=6239 RepID=CPG4_CAEEL|nr:Chondroitin proteoglycan 4 [Caenorhabditis elegans]O16883.3 RecName: Full=Chondroitin proteoglycan 4; Flags: Precursor [Caenorhabditis elegans]ABC65814.1 chondroitin proteoglycan-4 [Caenorhabditis elegans]CCD64120.1 Chondroitin proteoglycan 4 [Caenorhabditis elegans]|eukprot:NP_504556.3 Chondroitin proteoglycan 4 [Caenorhabditis elegans]
MRLVYSLIFLLFIPFSHPNPIPIPTISPETTNAYLRAFLPWWPEKTDFTLRTAPTPEESEAEIVGNLLESSGEKENVTEFATEKEEIDPSTLRVHDLPPSPLDEFAPEGSPKSLVASGARSSDGNFIISFDEMGECPRDCSNDLRDALGIILQDMSHVERYRQICGKYTNAITCVNEDTRCNKEDRDMFETMTSGLNYMCVEQKLAFNATIKCIDDEAGVVQSECDTQCQTKNLFMNWMMKTAFQDTIQQGVNGIVGAATGTNANPLAFLQPVAGAAGGAPGGGWADMLANIGQRPPSPQDAQQGFENFRQFTNDLCRIGDCMLDCIRSKFNTRCEGSAGTLLSEVFVRPIAATQNKLSILRPILGTFMPEQCGYLTNNAELKKHRIDATMDEELKRMYAEKIAKEARDRTAQDEILANLVPLDENGVPLPRALPELKSIESPLDVSVKTLDQLILDMYSNNKTEELNISEKNNVTSTFSEPSEKEDEASTTVISVISPLHTNATDSEILEHISEKSTEESSGSSGEMSGDGSDNEASGEGSGEYDASGSSGDNSGEFNSSGSSGEASEEGESSGSEDQGSGNYKMIESIESSGEFSGSSGEGSGDTASSDTSIDDKSIIRSGEGSAESVSEILQEASGEDAPTLTPTSEESTGYKIDHSGFGESSGSSGESIELRDSGEGSAEYDASGSSGDNSGDFNSSGSSGEASGVGESSGSEDQGSGNYKKIEVIESSGDYEFSGSSNESIEQSKEGSAASIYEILQAASGEDTPTLTLLSEDSTGY